MDRNSVYKYPCTIYMNYTIKQEEEDRPKQRCCVRMYMFVVYLVLLILASIFVSILTPPIHGKVSRDGWSRRRYQWCSLGGHQNNYVCTMTVTRGGVTQLRMTLTLTILSCIYNGLFSIVWWRLLY